jgi:hypothetical protein
MKRRTKWILWILIIAALAAFKIFVSPTDAELYERLNEQRQNALTYVNGDKSGSISNRPCSRRAACQPRIATTVQSGAG